ncbi:pentapeptide repeat-containing protein [Dietzia sp. PP-33]|uniref:pentapeptide repeat-containing protein n=1 Tax=Dietzia sp. PP-33 TaxID=2957500 RepID=UPI0029A58429|nr:pentapeptide repeat-containing protein [Dietzia sp. PP-33]MDX2358702.1 pentapeptide repeat-containing protein [Dietzia sp. PP-33]
MTKRSEEVDDTTRWGSALLMARARADVVARALSGIVGVVFVVGVGVLITVSGWSRVRQNWDAGEPWFTGFQAASIATPIAALIAAGAAITTAKWGLNAERDRRRVERRDTTERTLRDRFHELVKLLAADELRAREGAAHAIVALADDWTTHYRHDPHKAQSEQQVCVEVLISQLRDPLPDPLNATTYSQATAFKHTIQKLVRSRLGVAGISHPVPGVWSSLDLIFDGCVFHDLDFSDCVLSGDAVSFNGASFNGERTSFDGAYLDGQRVSFDGARFNTNAVSFSDAQFIGWRASFDGTRFISESVSFSSALFTGSDASFVRAGFAAETVSFNGASFVGASVSFEDAHFAGGYVSFNGSHFTARTWFDGAHFAAEIVSFDGSHFTGKFVSFADSRFTSRGVGFRFEELDVKQQVLLGDVVSTLPRDDFAPLMNAKTVIASGSRFGVSANDVPACQTCRVLTFAFERMSPR